MAASRMAAGSRSAATEIAVARLAMGRRAASVIPSRAAEKLPYLATQQFMFDRHIAKLKKFGRGLRDCSLDAEDRDSHAHEVLWIAAGEFSVYSAQEQREKHRTFYNFCCRRLAEKLQMATRPGEVTVSSRGRRYLRQLVRLLDGKATTMTDEQIAEVVHKNITKDAKTSNMLVRAIRGGTQTSGMEDDAGNDITDHTGGAEDPRYEAVIAKSHLDRVRGSLCQSACDSEQCVSCDLMNKCVCGFHMLLLHTGMETWYQTLDDAMFESPLTSRQIAKSTGCKKDMVDFKLEEARGLMQRVMAW